MADECFELDGAKVRGNPKMSMEARDALSTVISAARERLKQDEAERIRAFAVVCCRWHHAHMGGQPIPCVTAKREAEALIGLLWHAGYQVRRVRKIGDLR